MTTSADTIEVEDLPNTIINYKTSNYGDLPLEESVANFEKQLILNVLRNSKSTLEMADKLKIDVSTVRRKLKKYKIDNPFTARS